MCRLLISARYQVEKILAHDTNFDDVSLSAILYNGNSDLSIDLRLMHRDIETSPISGEMARL